jgi:hypothetical protein
VKTKKQSPIQQLQTKNHANKNGLELLKHNVALMVQPSYAYLHAFLCLSHKHTMLNSQHHSIIYKNSCSCLLVFFINAEKANIKPVPFGRYLPC